MHNWRLLLLAFFAAFQSIACFNERNFVNGRDQSCDHQPRSLFRDTRPSYGRYRFSKSEPEAHQLNQRVEIREDRRHEVRRDDSVFIRPTTDRRLVKYRSERGVKLASPVITRSEFRGEHLRLTEDQQREPISRGRVNNWISSENLGRKEVARSLRHTQYGFENRKLFSNELHRNNRRNVQSLRIERNSRVPIEFRRETLRNQDRSRKLKTINEIRETSNTLQQARGDVTFNKRNVMAMEEYASPIRYHSKIQLNNDQMRNIRITSLPESRRYLIRVARDISRIKASSDPREFVSPSESKRHLGTDKRSLNLNIRGDMMDDHREVTTRSEIIVPGIDRRSLARNEPRIARHRMEVRHAFSSRSESRLQHSNERQSLDRIERRSESERMNGRRLPFELDNERRSLDRSDQYGASERMDERRVASKLTNKRTLMSRSESRLHLDANRNAVDRNGGDWTDERRTFIAQSKSELDSEYGSVKRHRERCIAHERMDERREIQSQSESRLHLDNERRSLDRSNRRIANEMMGERRSTQPRFEFRDEHDNEHRSLNRNERRIAREQVPSSSESRLRLDNERKSLDRSERRITTERIDERKPYMSRSESRLHLDNERRYLDRSERRIASKKLAESLSFKLRSESRPELDKEHSVSRLQIGTIKERQSVDFRAVDRFLNTREELRMSLQNEARDSFDNRNFRNEQMAMQRHTRNINKQFRSPSSEERAVSDTRHVETARRISDRSNNRGSLVMTREARLFTDRLESHDGRREARLGAFSTVTPERGLSRIEYRDMKNTVERKESSTSFSTNTEFTRSRENFVYMQRDKVQHADLTPIDWKLLFYTLQGIYLCGILVRIMSNNGAVTENKRMLHWWNGPFQNLIKVD